MFAHRPPCRHTPHPKISVCPTRQGNRLTAPNPSGQKPDYRLNRLFFMDSASYKRFLTAIHNRYQTHKEQRKDAMTVANAGHFLTNGGTAHAGSCRAVNATSYPQILWISLTHCHNGWPCPPMVKTGFTTPLMLVWSVGPK